MAALEQDRGTQRRDGITRPYKVVADDCIYGGSLVAVNAAGYANPGADTAGLIFVGVAEERADNSGGAAGAIEVNVRRRGEFLFASASALTIANVGDSVVLSDDQTVALAADAINDIACGKITEVPSASTCWVSIDGAVG